MRHPRPLAKLPLPFRRIITLCAWRGRFNERTRAVHKGLLDAAATPKLPRPPGNPARPGRYL